MTRYLRDLGVFTAILGFALLPVRAFAAQPSASPPAVEELALDPIKCWWRSSAAAVIVGERFTLTLTCGIVDTERIKTMVNRDNLEPAALSLTPFEIVGGVRHEDVVLDPWRYFQYEYTARLVGQEFFGKDVPIPALGIMYNLVSTAGGTEEREHTYVLPPLSLRVTSLVPKEAADIREAPSASFGAIEARRFRSTTELVAAGVSSGVALLFFGLAIARAVSHRREKRPRHAVAATPRAALAGARHALAQLKRDVARDGWSVEAVARALGPLRLGAAAGLNRRIAQAPAKRGRPLREGQVLLRAGLRRRPIVASAATGPRILQRASAGRTDGGRRAADLDALAEALSVFSAVRYGRNGSHDTTTLDDAMARADQALRRLYVASWRPGRATDSPPSPGTSA